MNNEIQKQNRKKNISLFFIVLIAFLVGGASMYAIVYFTPLLDNNNSTTGLKKKNNTTVVEKSSLANSVAKAYDAVVMVQGYTNDIVSSTGTGFIYKTDEKYAYLMTNQHVVGGATKITVITSTDEEVEVTVLGQDEYLDLAVLRMDISKANGVVEIGDSTNQNVGDTVFTIGSPLGYDYRGSVTAGILSGTDRMVTVSVGNSTSGDWVMRVLQTDAAINPGNSGGPLLNVNGEVIGINSLKLVQEEIEGMGFAIPIEYAMSHIESLESGKTIEWPVLGISMLNANDTTSLYRNNITIDKSITTGVVVVKISENTGASNSELQIGDVITSINGQEVDTFAFLRYELYKYQVGDTIDITYIRGTTEHTCKIKLTKSSE